MSQWMTNCLDSLPMQARLDTRGKLFSRDSPSHVLLKTQGRSWCSHLFHKQQGERHIYSILSVNPSTVLQCYTTLPFPAWQAAALWWDFLSWHISSLSLNKGHRHLEGEWQPLGTAVETLTMLAAMHKPARHSSSLVTCFSATALLITSPPAWSWTQAVNLGRLSSSKQVCWTVLLPSKQRNQQHHLLAWRRNQQCVTVDV